MIKLNTYRTLMIPETHLNDEMVPSNAKDLNLIKKKQQQIIDGACRLFFKKGFHNTTIREIALSAGMSMGQLYHYISSKDDVLFLIYKHMQTIWYDHLVQSGIDRLDDPLDRLKKAISLTIDFVMKHRKLFLFVYTETKYLNKRHLKLVLEMDDRNVVGFWKNLIKDAGLNTNADINFLANLLSHIMLFLPLRKWNIKRKIDQDIKDSLVDFILKGLELYPHEPKKRR